MKKLVAMVAFVGAVTGMSMAQDTTKPDVLKEMTLRGIVVKVEENVVTVAAPGTGRERKVTTDDKTVVTIDGKDSKVADLKADMMVEVTAPRGRKVVATKIVATKTPASAPATGEAPVK